MWLRILTHREALFLVSTLLPTFKLLQHPFRISVTALPSTCVKFASTDQSQSDATSGKRAAIATTHWEGKKRDSEAVRHCNNVSLGPCRHFAR